MDVRAVCYLIMLMDSRHKEVTPAGVSELWQKLVPGEQLDEAELEPLLQLWKNAGRVDRGEGKPRIPAARCFPVPAPAQPAPEPEPATVDVPKAGVSSPKGRYMYGIVMAGERPLNVEGIEGNRIFEIRCREAAALVHACVPEPYASADRDQAMGWVARHQEVLDAAMEHYAALIPMGFDVIIDGSAEEDPDRLVREWMENRYDALMETLKHLAGKVEYGIRGFCPTEQLTRAARDRDPGIAELEQKIAVMGKGAAYLFRSELEERLRTGRDKVKASMVETVVRKVRPVVTDLVEEAPQKGQAGDGGEPVLKLAVLAPPEKAGEIGGVLEACQAEMGLTVEFTGPWPAYSFVKNLDEE